MVPPPGPDDPKDRFLEHLPTIERIIAKLARAKALVGDEADDFRSWVLARLIENDYAALGKFAGRSSMGTFLTVVIGNLYRDYRVHEWGRWRPSVAAKRLGREALRLEALLYRDGYVLEQATEVMRSTGSTLTDRELRELAAKIPVRVRNAGRADLPMPEGAAAPGRADDEFWQDEEAREWRGVLAVLARALESLPAEDRVLVRLRYLEGFSVAEIARKLHLEQKPLYRRLDAALKQLRTRLEAEGLDRDELRGFFDFGEPS